MYPFKQELLAKNETYRHLIGAIEYLGKRGDTDDYAAVEVLINRACLYLAAMLDDRFSRTYAFQRAEYTLTETLGLPLNLTRQQRVNIFHEDDAVHFNERIKYECIRATGNNL